MKVFKLDNVIFAIIECLKISHATWLWFILLLIKLRRERIVIVKVTSFATYVTIEVDVSKPTAHCSIIAKEITKGHRRIISPSGKCFPVQHVSNNLQASTIWKPTLKRYISVRVNFCAQIAEKVLRSFLFYKNIWWVMFMFDGIFNKGNNYFLNEKSLPICCIFSRVKLVKNCTNQLFKSSRKICFLFLK